MDFNIHLKYIKGVKEQTSTRIIVTTKHTDNGSIITKEETIYPESLVKRKMLQAILLVLWELIEDWLRLVYKYHFPDKEEKQDG